VLGVSSTPIPAASVILLRQRTALEMLMVERPVKATFGGLWAFPGGAIETVDSSEHVMGFDDPWRAAGLRETAEEVGIFLTDPPDARPEPGGDVFAALTRAGARFDPGRLRYVASWITPEGVPWRFDARFYTAAVGDDVEGFLLDTGELVDMAWIAPAETLRRADAADWHMALPTRWLVEQLVAADDPYQVPQHPIRQLKGLIEPFEIMDFGLPPEEVV